MTVNEFRKLIESKIQKRYPSCCVTDTKEICYATPTWVIQGLKIIIPVSKDYVFQYIIRSDSIYIMWKHGEKYLDNYLEHEFLMLKHQMELEFRMKFEYGYDINNV